MKIQKIWYCELLSFFCHSQFLKIPLEGVVTIVTKRSSAPLRIAVETDANIFTTVAREGGSDLGSSTRSAHCTVGVRNSVGFWLIRLFTKCYATRARKKSVTQSHCIWVARLLGPQGITEKFWNFAILLLRVCSHIFKAKPNAKLEFLYIKASVLKLNTKLKKYRFKMYFFGSK